MPKKNNKIQPIEMITVFTNLGRYIEVPKHSLKSAVQRGIIDDYIHIEDNHDYKENLKKNKENLKIIKQNGGDPIEIDSEICIGGSALKCIKMLKQNKNESSPIL
jgi:hypothetical protein